MVSEDNSLSPEGVKRRTVKDDSTNSSDTDVQETDNIDTTQQQPVVPVTIPPRRREQKEITGNNGRKVAVLSQGSGDYTKNPARPKRQPGHMAELTDDQADLVRVQMSNRLRDVVSVLQQTETVVVLETDREILDFIAGQKKKTSDVSTQTPPSFDLGSKLDTILSVLNSLKDAQRTSPPSSYQLDNIADDTLTDFLNVITGSTPSTPHRRDNLPPIDNIYVPKPSTPNQITTVVDIHVQPAPTPSADIPTTPSQPADAPSQPADAPSPPADIPTPPAADRPTPAADRPTPAADIPTPAAADIPTPAADRPTTPTPAADRPTTPIPAAHRPTTPAADRPTPPAAARPTSPTDRSSAATTISTTVCEATLRSLTRPEHSIATSNPTTLQELISSTFTIAPETDNVLHEEPLPSILASTETTRFGRLPMSSCQSGPMQVISSHKDAVTPLQELRVHPNVQSECYQLSCKTPSNLVWMLTQRLYESSELQGRNFTGQKGKIPISPRRKHAIQHAVIDTYGRDQLKIVGHSINNGIRNLNRKLAQ